jgi:two-component system nitrogen regulation sensor histidine kinase NtrY
LNTWFNKKSYLGWIAIFVISLVSCAILYHYEKKDYSAVRLASYVQRHFNQAETAVQRDQAAGVFQRFLQSDSVPEVSGNYLLFICRNKEILSWNTIVTDLPDDLRNQPEHYLEGKLTRLYNGTYYVISQVLESAPQKAAEPAYAVVLIPLVYEYSIENEYFHSHFAADERIPMSTGIDTVNTGKGLVIRNVKGKAAFYLHFQEQTEYNYVISIKVWLLIFILSLSLFAWVNKWCYNIGKQKKPLIGWLVLSAFCGTLFLVLRYLPLPIGFANSRFFSPELLASGDGIKSLGDLMIKVLLDAWILIYFILYVPVNGVAFFKNRYLDQIVKLAAVCILIYILYSRQADNMYRLVIDSKISFEVSDFYRLSIFTFVGIFTLSVITINFIAILGIANELLKTIVRRYMVKYAIIVAISAVCIYFMVSLGGSVFLFAVMLMSVAGLLLLDAFGLPLLALSGPVDLSNSPRTYIWFAILCSWVTLEIFYFNYSKEKDLRVIFAQKQAQQDDALVAYAFDGFASKLQKDTTVKAFWYNPVPDERSKVNKYIFYTYLSESTRKYSINVCYYDRNLKPLSNADTADTWLKKLGDSISGGPFRYGILNVEGYAHNNTLYWAICPVPSPDGKDTLGYVGFGTSIDKRPKMLYMHSFIGRKYNPTDQQYFDKYAYGIYRNNNLWTQGGHTLFPYRLSGVLDTSEVFFRQTMYESTLFYRSNNEEVIQVVYNRNLLTDIISLFSYVLAVMIALVAVTYIIRRFFLYPGRMLAVFRSFNFTIRSKVNLTILITVFASLFVVGVITLSFLNSKYKETQRRNLRSMLLYYSQSILHYAEDNSLNLAGLKSDLFNIHSDLSYQLRMLAEEQGADINLYDENARLIATSQVELMQKGFIAHHMERKALLTLRSGEKSELILEDKIGNLKYQSVYAPLRDKHDNIFAYVNLPYYASRAERNDEISNVLASLINVYTLIFFISGISAILISNSIIRSFRLLINQFRVIRLRHNQLIKWPYKDEIGLLVKEYNAMMQKVEGMASKLARTEREEAWREIAKQVAHEIKNPLTPMKLNIQYLQEAIRNGRSDIDVLASRVSVTLIEQIENLNLIATEFSNYAKMPEAVPELLNVKDALQTLVVLFQKDALVSVELAPGDAALNVYIDKSYFIRIFNNLIQNAIQAIPDDKEGHVQISYSRDEQDVIIAIKDNGTGIPDEQKEELFVPYFTTKSSGTGLGLPMTKSMVEHSGGKIWFETEKDTGTVFYVQLSSEIQ